MKLKLLIILLIPIFVKGQSISGYIKDSENGSPLSGVNITIDDKGTVTDANGYYKLDIPKQGKYKIAFSCIGYIKQIKEVIISDKEIILIDIQLIKEDVYLDEVVVSATRTENRISQIPGRINMISPEKLSMIASTSIDESLQLLPGVNVSRSFGIFSTKSSVTMRGLSGNEQARTLVLLDEIPVNKADGGSVNWNLISSGEVERIEVVKGPGSALYGGNAMGGIINVITHKPVKSIEGNITADYGTYNTKIVRANLAGKVGKELNKGFYWTSNGFYQKSDGYITQSKADQNTNPFIIKSNVDEKAFGFKVGYLNNIKINIESNFCIYDGLRGTGEKVFQPEGNTTEYLTYQARTNLNGEVGVIKWNTSIFYIDEHYMRVNESKKDDYTWYNVNSIRRDLGLLSSINYSIGKHSFTTGFDIRNGQVDASDIYYTSTDKVDNNGKMNFYGFYAQDDYTVTEKFKLLFGIRYDMARFYDGLFKTYHPSAESSFLRKYEFSNIDDVKWGAFSPRISLQYRPNDNFRIYSGYSRGFRPSVLDDLCRTGRVKGGMKIANPNLKPEYLDNIEVGSDYSPTRNLRLSSSIYYSIGTDFLYYVSTGDSIDMGYGDRPIMIRSNISNVNIYGVELDISYNPINSLNLFGNYSYSHAQISDYKPLSNEDPVDLSNKYLTDVPKHSFSSGGFFKNKIINIGITCHYKGEMYVNDQNIYDEIVLSNKYPSWLTVDLKLSQELIKHVNVMLNIQNIFDEQIYDSKGAVGPGRFITFGISVKI